MLRLEIRSSWANMVKVKCKVGNGRSHGASDEDSGLLGVGRGSKDCS